MILVNYSFGQSNMPFWLLARNSRSHWLHGRWLYMPWHHCRWNVQNVSNEVTMLLCSPFKMKIHTHMLMGGIRQANIWQNSHFDYAICKHKNLSNISIESIKVEKTFSLYIVWLWPQKTNLSTSHRNMQYTWLQLRSIWMDFGEVADRGVMESIWLFTVYDFRLSHKMINV